MAWRSRGWLGLRPPAVKTPWFWKSNWYEGWTLRASSVLGHHARFIPGQSESGFKLERKARDGSTLPKEISSFHCDTQSHFAPHPWQALKDFRAKFQTKTENEMWILGQTIKSGSTCPPSTLFRTSVVPGLTELRRSWRFAVQVWKTFTYLQSGAVSSVLRQYFRVVVY